MTRVINFSPGPSILPESVLKQAAAEMLDYRGTGMSVMEMSHRSETFLEIIEGAEVSIRQLLSVPANFKVLFLQGGASTQFAMVPLNLFRKKRKAGYLHTGAWSHKAIAEAKRYGTVQVLASSEEDRFTRIPDLGNLRFDPGMDYVHFTSNNTIFGTSYRDFPHTGSIPLVADMSSDILSKEIEVPRFGLIYAGAQKNAGPAGLTLVIIREDLIGHALPETPTMLDYQTAAKARSLYNTPPCYAIYIAGLVFRWLLDQGGLSAMEALNRHKAALLYDFLDGSTLFKATVAEPFRSIMNIPFLLPDNTMNTQFLAQAEAAGFVNLKGHRSVGGMRASIYNAMPAEAVQALVNFMKTFEKNI